VLHVRIQNNSLKLIKISETFVLNIIVLTHTKKKAFNYIGQQFDHKQKNYWLAACRTGTITSEWLCFGLYIIKYNN